MRLHVRSIGDAYAGICQQVLSQGARVAPRGQATFEVLDAVIIAEDPTDCLPTGCGRKLNPAIGVAEAMQLVGGFTEPDLMVRISKNFEMFLDDGAFHGAYGPRAVSQIPEIVRKLRADKDTRQAVVTIWQPHRDNEPGKHDYPCTISLIFTIRDDALNIHVTMRSNDVWWGLAYDAFQFTQLQCTVANVLNIKVGRYHHHVVSLHAYERDADGIESLWLVRDPGTSVRTEGFGYPGIAVGHAMARPRMILSGQPLERGTTTEEWMSGVLSRYLEARDDA